MLKVTDAIRNDWGTVKRYAKVKKLDYATLRHVLRDIGRSEKIERQLEQDGYLRLVGRSRRPNRAKIENNGGGNGT